MKAKLGDKALLKICGCGYERITRKESNTKCPQCGANDNWEFIPVVMGHIGWI